MPPHLRLSWFLAVISAGIVMPTPVSLALAHNVACGITALNARDIGKRLEDGGKMIRTTEAALTQWRATQTGR